MIRKILRVDEEKCNGCGIYVNAYHKGALQLIDGKARLVFESYCDAIGDCLTECPTEPLPLRKGKLPTMTRKQLKII